MLQKVFPHEKKCVVFLQPKTMHDRNASSIPRSRSPHVTLNVEEQLT